jgi:[acyl-carrier-protein] S-malonyltransferase
VEAAPNVDAARIAGLLVQQVVAPVRWIECVQAMAGAGVTHMVEIGPGKVLAGLVRRIDKSIEMVNVEDPASLDKALAALA